MIHAPRYLGLDMGGTTVKVGALDAIGGFEPFGLFPTPALDDAEQCARFVEDVAYLSACHAVLPEDVRAIGIAIPGVADEQGCVSLAPNVSLDLKRVLAAFSVSFPTAVLAHLNDANAAALAEWEALSQLEPVHSLMLVTLGTGVGAGFVIDGAFMEGAHGAAGEMGHLTIKSSGRLCNCGRMGCLERYVSSGGLVLTFREVESLSHATSICRPASDTDAAEVFRAAREGDPCAREAVLLFADDLGHGLAQAACLLDPSLIVLGGGLSASSDLFIGDVRRAFFDAALVPCKETQIEAARLGNDAGMRGAASCAERAWKRASSNE